MSAVTVFGLALAVVGAVGGLVGNHPFLALVSGAGLVWFALRVSGVLS